MTSFKDILVLAAFAPALIEALPQIRRPFSRGLEVPKPSFLAQPSFAPGGALPKWSAQSAKPAPSGDALNVNLGSSLENYATNAPVPSSYLDAQAQSGAYFSVAPLPSNSSAPFSANLADVQPTAPPYAMNSSSSADLSTQLTTETYASAESNRTYTHTHIRTRTRTVVVTRHHPLSSSEPSALDDSVPDASTVYRTHTITTSACPLKSSGAPAPSGGSDDAQNGDEPKTYTITTTACPLKTSDAPLPSGAGDNDSDAQQTTHTITTTACPLKSSGAPENSGSPENSGEGDKTVIFRTRTLTLTRHQHKGHSATGVTTVTTTDSFTSDLPRETDAGSADAGSGDASPSNDVVPKVVTLTETYYISQSIPVVRTRIVTRTVTRKHHGQQSASKDNGPLVTPPPQPSFDFSMPNSTSTSSNDNAAPLSANDYAAPVSAAPVSASDDSDDDDVPVSASDDASPISAYDASILIPSASANITSTGPKTPQAINLQDFLSGSLTTSTPHTKKHRHSHHKHSRHTHKPRHSRHVHRSARASAVPTAPSYEPAPSASEPETSAPRTSSPY